MAGQARIGWPHRPSVVRLLQGLAGGGLGGLHSLQDAAIGAGGLQGSLDEAVLVDARDDAAWELGRSDAGTQSFCPQPCPTCALLSTLQGPPPPPLPGACLAPPPPEHFCPHTWTGCVPGGPASGRGPLQPPPAPVWLQPEKRLAYGSGVVSVPRPGSLPGALPPGGKGTLSGTSPNSACG